MDMIILILLVSLLGKIYSPNEFMEAYWEVIGRPRECFLIFVNAGIDWLPETMGLNLKMLEKTSNRDVRGRDSTFYVKRTSKRCARFLKVPNLTRSDTEIIKIDIKAHWGENIVIDNSSWTIDSKEPREDQNVRFIPGERKILEFWLEFVTGMYSFPKYKTVNVKWSGVVKEIINLKPLCMSIFNRRGIYRLFPHQKSIEIPLLHIYSILELTSYVAPDMQQILHEHTHLVKIYTCDLADNPQMEVVVPDVISVVTVTISEVEKYNIYRMKFVREDGVFSKMTDPDNFPHMLNVGITTQELKAVWKDRETKFLLYRQYLKTKRCVIPSDPYKKDVQIQMFIEGGEKYVTDSRTMILDPSFKISHRRIATPDEEAWCKNFQ